MSSEGQGQTEEISASDFVNQQKQLEDEARELMPWEPKQCTYELGSIRQPVFACRSHNQIGICYSCSILCHTSCDIVELFTKRHFTCDCGTERDTKAADEDGIHCQLRKNRSKDISSDSNEYRQNFKGLFCGCSTEYDPENPAVMLQCVLGTECGEDWFHDYCILGKPKEEADELRARKQPDAENDDELEVPLAGMPDLETFDAFVCWKCTSKYEQYFKRLLSHPLSETVIAKQLYRQCSEVKETDDGKRKHDEGSEDYSLFLKKDHESAFKKILESSEADSKIRIFLTDLAPHLIKDEPVYEPPEEKEETLSIEALTRQIIQNAMDRHTAVEGLTAFHSLKDKLNSFLAPFAEAGQTVKEEDIVTFFSKSKH